MLARRIVWECLKQICRLFPVGRRFSKRFIKFWVVGGLGVGINLVVMALLMGTASIRGWRASALASLAANLHNYLLNNFWTFIDRTHRGLRLLFKGYFSYLSMSVVGLTITTVAYAGLNWGLSKFLLLPSQPSRSFEPALLSCQLVAILLGLRANYELNRTITCPAGQTMLFGRFLDKL